MGYILAFIAGAVSGAVSMAVLILMSMEEGDDNV